MGYKCDTVRNVYHAMKSCRIASTEPLTENQKIDFCIPTLTWMPLSPWRPALTLTSKIESFIQR